MQRKFYRRTAAVFLPAIALLLIAGAANLFAQLNTAKIEGTITDQSTGQSMAGVQVTVEGTKLGNVTNADGYYFILNIPPGLRSITFSYTGYQKTTIADQLLLAGQTSTVNAELSSTIINLEGIVVQGESEVLMPRDNTATKHRLTSEEITAIPASRLEDLMVIQAGVQIGGEGDLGRNLRIRGGRVGETAMVVDGVTLRNYTANPLDQGSRLADWENKYEVGVLGEDATPLEISTSSVEEVDIITGGFQAEYGNAQSGIINIVTREGWDKFRGSMRYITDEVMPATADWGYNQLQANLGGPVSFIPGMNYYISGEIQGAKDRTPTHASEGFRGVNEDFVKHLNDAVADDPILGAGPEPAYTLDMFKTGKEFYASKTGADPGLFTPFNPVRLPINWMDRTLGSGKLTYAPGKNLKLIFTSNMSRNQHTYPAGLHMGQGSYYATGIATISQIPNSPWWDMSDDTTLTMTQSQSRRTKTFNYLSGFDWNFYSTAERQGSLQFRYSNMRTQDINNATLRANYERDTFLSWSYHDIPFEIESYPNREMPYSAEDRAQYVPDGITGWKNDFIYVTPFAATTDQGDTWLYLLRYRYSYEKQNNYKVDMGFQLDKHNRAKTGLQVTTLNNHSFNMGAESAQRDLGNEFRYDPKIYAFYLQNRTDLGDFVLDYGLRYDFFKPEDNWGLRSGDQFEEIFYPKTIKALSPRFDVAFPVTDKSQLRFSYGTFAQLPGMEFLFTSGNAGDLEYSRTDAFEMGISRLLSDDIVLDFVAFYRDVTGNVASKEYFRDYYRWHAERWVRDWVTGYTNRDNGNIKGIDIALRKRFSKNFAFDATYTLQFSRTTGSHHVSTGYLIDFMDTSTGERFTPPDEIRPINGDRTHNLNVNFNYLFPEDFLAGTKGNLILGDLRINAILKLMSGQPIDNLVQSYTGEVRYRYMTYRGGKPIGGLNYFRSDWFYNLDLRFSKSFRLTNTRRLSFFGEIFNALNRKGANPYPSGYGLTSSNLTVIGGTDRAWEDDWNNDVITRSRFQCDFNGDGVLTVMEAAKGAIADQLMESTMDKKRWGRARQVRFGLEIAF